MFKFNNDILFVLALQRYDLLGGMSNFLYVEALLYIYAVNHER